MGFLDQLFGSRAVAPGASAIARVPSREGLLPVPVSIAVPGEAQFSFVEKIDHESTYEMVK